MSGDMIFFACLIGFADGALLVCMFLLSNILHEVRKSDILNELRNIHRRMDP